MTIMQSEFQCLCGFCRNWTWSHYVLDSDPLRKIYGKSYGLSQSGYDANSNGKGTRWQETRWVSFFKFMGL